MALSEKVSLLPHLTSRGTWLRKEPLTELMMHIQYHENDPPACHIGVPAEIARVDVEDS